MLPIWITPSRTCTCTCTCTWKKREQKKKNASWKRRGRMKEHVSGMNFSHRIGHASCKYRIMVVFTGTAENFGTQNTEPRKFCFVFPPQHFSVLASETRVAAAKRNVKSSSRDQCGKACSVMVFSSMQISPHSRAAQSNFIDRYFFSFLTMIMKFPCS